MRIRFEKPWKTKDGRALATGVVVKTPGVDFYSMVVFPIFWSNISSLK